MGAMYSIIATLAYFLTIVSGLYDPVTKVALPHVETYWESWEDGLENFSSNLSDVPVAPMGATHGVNIVNIAFADPRILEDDCAYAENQLYLIYRLRSLLPNKIISYTFPSSPNYSPTYSLVIQSSISHLDYVSISQCSQSGRISGINELLEMGVPQHKIVCGVILYRDCYYNENNGGMGNTIAAAELVLSEQLGGVMTWSINTDTDHRGDNEVGSCTDFQTGKSDGT